MTVAYSSYGTRAHIRPSMGAGRHDRISRGSLSSLSKQWGRVMNDIELGGIYRCVPMDPGGPASLVLVTAIDEAAQALRRHVA